MDVRGILIQKIYDKLDKMGDSNKLENVSDHESNQFLRLIAIVAVVLIIFLSLPPLVTGDCGHSHHSHDHQHGHDHDHHHEEPANFKWTKQANEAYEDHHHHNHDEHGHSHGQEHAEKTTKTAQSKTIYILNQFWIF